MNQDEVVGLIINAYQRGQARGWKEGYEEGELHGVRREADHWVKQVQKVVKDEKIDSPWALRNWLKAQQEE